MRSQFSFPLQIGAIRLGVLTLYRDWPAALSEEDMAKRRGSRGGRHSAAAAPPGRLGHDAAACTPTSDTPFVATAELHQATGMVSVQAAVGMAEALLLLRSRAFSTESTPLDVAHDVLAGRVHFRPGTEP